MREMTDKEFEKYEEAINAAMAARNFEYDLSGGAR